MGGSELGPPNTTLINLTLLCVFGAKNTVDTFHFVFTDFYVLAELHFYLDPYLLTKNVDPEHPQSEEVPSAPRTNSCRWFNSRIYFSLACRLARWTCPGPWPSWSTCSSLTSPGATWAACLVSAYQGTHSTLHLDYYFYYSPRSLYFSVICRYILLRNWHTQEEEKSELFTSNYVTSIF